ncbi:hypothetical protein DFJ58DRAFT_799449 [Suillus subalutaceus]|uniref:uncharacterized protein n=1 Tax=Suillus subalutaceus TaxID=48586 RepID=UPI001B884853|nr:uncharacterized protein DFJ58DRAFT_799449 [Suillus subalutaceus]KAG1846202.1 hypothetical protein DFJ58DRAFT_799449 [Suillus subalutaceus]
MTRDSNFEDTINFLFPPHVLEDAETCLQRAFLSPLNIYVDEFNDKILEKLPGDFQSYFSLDSLKEADHTI